MTVSQIAMQRVFVVALTAGENRVEVVGWENLPDSVVSPFVVMLQKSSGPAAVE